MQHHRPLSVESTRRRASPSTPPSMRTCAPLGRQISIVPSRAELGGSHRRLGAPPFPATASFSAVEAEALVDAFVADWLSARPADHLGNACRRDRNLVSATVRQFFSLVVAQSEYRRARKPWGDPFAAQAPGFFEYLRAERGLRQRSLRIYQHYLRRFERYLHQVECPDIGSLALPVVTGFVTTAAQEFGSRAMVGLCSTLQVFLRYAYKRAFSSATSASWSKDPSTIG